MHSLNFGIAGEGISRVDSLAGGRSSGGCELYVAPYLIQLWDGSGCRVGGMRDNNYEVHNRDNFDKQ